MTFITVAVILSIVFIVLVVEARDRMRAAETDKLDISSRVFTAFEMRRAKDQPRDDGNAGRDSHAQGRRSTPTTPRPDWERPATVGSRPSRRSRASSRSWRRSHRRACWRSSTPRAACSPAREAPGSSGR